MPVTVSHDAKIDIATGKARTALTWKNSSMLWSELLTRISETHRTHETIAEYLASKKPRQDEIKDVGGFVGGYLTGGRRRSGSVLHRQLLTLDIDYGRPGVWDDFTLLFSCAAAVYSTHKHTPQNPRLRLLIPLSREVACDEYLAIARRLAQQLDIELFDPTTYQPERLMYWPSTSKDGEYEFQYQDGSWLDVDTVLATYTDWKDSSEWPTSSKESERITRAAKKQGDPLEKPGLVGIFCRTYSIEAVIDKYLSDVYEPCDVEHRFTYKHGSTAAGLVVYDDKFAYSHHGTDPTSGKLCNAFDLVRIHKFGLKDEDAREGTPAVKMPSYQAMLELISGDAKVRVQIGQEKIQEAFKDFDEVGNGLDGEEVSPEPESDELPAGILPEASADWMEKLDVDRKGNYYPTIDNLVLMLENDPVFRGGIGFDEFEGCMVFTRQMPWRKVTKQTRYLTDRDADSMEHHLEKIYSISTAKFEKALNVLSYKKAFHPVRDYLNSLVWDKVPRVDRLLIEYLGAEDSEYTRAVTRKTLVAAVARIFKPGIKFDNILTAVGEEGKGKSTLFDKLGQDWFSDTFTLHMLQSKDAYDQLRGVWIVEVAELSGMARAEEERVKGFTSAKKDRYRVAYTRRTENFYRQNIFVASTNRSDFLKSLFGNRRFWPVEIFPENVLRSVFTDFGKKEVDQVWAEAVYMYQQGEPLFLDPQLEKQAREVQKEHTEEHPWTDLIRDFLDTKLPNGWDKMGKYDKLEWLSGDPLAEKGTRYRDRVCMIELWEIGLKKRDTIDSYHANILRGIMRNLGWREEKKVAKYGSYGPQRRGFFRTQSPDGFLEIPSVTGDVINETSVTDFDPLD